MVHRALVVDNHPVILKFMKVLLENRGYEVATASDGLSALETLKAFTPDVVFVDLVMPNINGEKLCRMMRRSPAVADSYIIVLSAIAAEAQLDHSAFGADACIAKGPFESMAGNIRALLERYEKEGRPPVQKDIIGAGDLKKRVIIKELLAVKRHFEKVLDHLSEGVLELASDQKIVYANPAAARMIGAQEEELLGTCLEDHMKGPHGERLRNLLRFWKKDVEEPEETAPMAFNGRLLVLEAMPLREEERSSCILILKDMTREKRIEARLREAQRMEAIGTLAGGIAHQFNNNLAVVVGNMEFMRMSFPESRDLARYLEPMREAVNRMAQIGDHLLAYARGGKYDSKVILLSAFLEQTLPLLQHALGPRIRLQTDIQTAGLYVDIDMSQMQMVLSALLSNASEAMGEEGMIRLECRGVRTPMEGQQEHNPLDPGRYVCLSVQDTGHGMDDEARQKVFEPFFTTKLQGRGLGMSAVYGIVRNHGGWISIDSTPGKGTTVNLFLPEAGPKTRKPQTAAFPKKPSNGTLLLLESDPMVRDVSRALIEGLGYSVLVADTGEGALTLAASQGRLMDAVILDILIPDMEPQAFYARLKQARPDVKLIVCGGDSKHGPARAVLDSGAEGFLPKPFALEMLAAILQEVLKEQR